MLIQSSDKENKLFAIVYRIYRNSCAQLLNKNVYSALNCDTQPRKSVKTRWIAACWDQNGRVIQGLAPTHPNSLNSCTKYWGVCVQAIHRMGESMCEKETVSTCATVE